MLLLVSDERKVGVEEVVGGVAVALLHEVDDVDEHVGEGVAGHCAVGSTLHLEVEEEATVAGEDGERAQGAVALEGSQRGDLFEAGPVFVLQHDAGWVVGDDLADDFGRHDDCEHERVILEDPWNVGADGGDGLREVADDLVVGAEGGRWSDHDSGGSGVHDTAGEGSHRGQAWG